MKVEKGDILLCKKNCKNFLDIRVFEIGNSYKVYSVDKYGCSHIDSGENVYSFNPDYIEDCFYSKSEARYVKLKNLQDKT